ncbi:prolyl hydroxylase family protein [Simiduia aestuariiviva]|uniref:Fe2OG dioxygenase domain-containing protein n=1 Tax=Simiduia aestuariiviva TaxID=1510459 RepID=A0A839URS6_9GAMM|nr:2OG-Fe(II) oxygenase [Simiduia aestuariiviva]MBB3169190.1 hypothetical protein [Simiduia aestuariiviva]
MSKTKVASVGGEHVLVQEAHKGSAAALRKLIQAALKVQAFNDLDKWLNVALDYELSEFYDLRIRLWLADMWGPWPWEKIDALLDTLGESHTDYFWLKSKVALFLGGDCRDPLIRGEMADDLRCAIVMALFGFLDGNHEQGRQRMFELSKQGQNFARLAVSSGLVDYEATSEDYLIDQSIGLKGLDHFVHPLVCKWVVAQYGGYCKRSMIVDPVSGERKIDPYRVSSSCTILPPIEDPIVFELKKRMASQQGISLECVEPFSMIHYREGDEYKLHFDALPQEALKNGEAQRTRTSILYLNDEFRGGETRFPRIAKTVTPKTGRLITFNNTVTHDQTPMPNSLHAGSPIAQGNKFILTLWGRGAPPE